MSDRRSGRSVVGSVAERYLGSRIGLSFGRGMAMGLLVGAAIAGSTIWNRLRGSRPPRRGPARQAGATERRLEHPPMTGDPPAASLSESAAEFAFEVVMALGRDDATGGLRSVAMGLDEVERRRVSLADVSQRLRSAAAGAAGAPDSAGASGSPDSSDAPVAEWLLAGLADEVDAAAAQLGAVGEAAAIAVRRFLESTFGASVPGAIGSARDVAGGSRARMIGVAFLLALDSAAEGTEAPVGRAGRDAASRRLGALVAALSGGLARVDRATAELLAGLGPSAEGRVGPAGAHADASSGIAALRAELDALGALAARMRARLDLVLASVGPEPVAELVAGAIVASRPPSALERAIEGDRPRRRFAGWRSSPAAASALVVALFTVAAVALAVVNMGLPRPGASPPNVAAVGSPSPALGPSTPGGSPAPGSSATALPSPLASASPDLAPSDAPLATAPVVPTAGPTSRPTARPSSGPQPTPAPTAGPAAAFITRMNAAAGSITTHANGIESATSGGQFALAGSRADALATFASGEIDWLRADQNAPGTCYDHAQNDAVSALTKVRNAANAIVVAAADANGAVITNKLGVIRAQVTALRDATTAAAAACQ